MKDLRKYRFSKRARQTRANTARGVINQLKKDNKKLLLAGLAFFKKKHKTRSDYQVWQQGSHPQMIISDHMLIQKIKYIHNNPVKRGLVDQPAHWRYNSARNCIMNDQSIIKINKLPL